MIEINRPKVTYTTDPDNENHGTLVLEPLERGYGQTLGNSFRRVLLASLPGSAVSSVKIDGVLHEFCSIPGVVEDVTEIVLNLKKLVVNLEQDEPLTVRLEVKGPCQVTAADIAENDNLTIIDKDVHIAHVTGNITLGMDITFKRGRGYHLADQHKENNQPIGLILVDSQYSPVTKVMYNVDDARVGQDINFDKLTLQVWTNGSMEPSECIELAAKFLKAHIDLFTDIELEEEVEEEQGDEDEKPGKKEDLVMVSSQKKETPQKGHHDILIKDLEFSVRSRNCLKKAGINTLGDLVMKKTTELLEIKNFGKKSLKEVREKLSQFNLQLPGDENGGGTDE
ncbi:MAG TPA: DNA-directed RNA polymerase subunit alpha [Candidatus Ozemobacteraceae bacterium]|nr:DNA-directed RNA polymerase subunit alpha [Candidatus Ozemobacteraceae bacterium]